MNNRNTIIGIIMLFLLGGIYFIANKNMNKTNEQGRVNNNTSVIQSHRSYSLKLLFPNTFKPNKETLIRYKITDERGEILKDFQENHTKIMHFIIVRSDLQDFQHVHPQLDTTTGEFTVPVTFNNNGKYRLFADFTPANGQKDPEGNYLGVTAPLDITVGSLQYTKHDVVPDTQTVKTIGDYQITYIFPQSLQVGNLTTITLNVAKNGQPVTDMEEYLGAQAHGILITKDTLGFAHLHAMGEGMAHMMNGEMMTVHGRLPKGPEIKFDHTFPEAGIYKLFTQFQYEGKVITTDYALVVK